MEYYAKFSLVKLKLLLVLFLIIIPLSASNEFVNNVLNNDQMLIVLNKRLGNLNNYHSDASNHDSTGSKQTYGSASVSESIDKSSHLSRSSGAFNSNDQAFCERKLRDGVIIKATESIKAGATYIDSIKDVASKEICIQYCCQNTTCDVAVYQDKGDRFCYLFQCDGKCIFKEHAGYYVIDISHKKLEQSEEELHSLNNDLQDLSSSASKEKTFNDQISKKEDTVKTAENKYQEEPKPDKVIPVANFPPTEPVIAPHSVGIKGYCTQSMQCEDPNAACIDHNCYCKMGYYIKDGLCRKVCSASSFECFELGTLSRGPECISRDQVCDSYMHCADGSDEFNCENIAASAQASDLSKLGSNGKMASGGQAQQSLSKPAVQEPAKLVSQGDTGHTFGLNLGSKVNMQQQDKGTHPDQVSRLNNGVKSVVKPALPPSMEQTNKNENIKTNKQHFDNSDPDSNPIYTDSSFTNTNTNLENENSPTFKNNFKLIENGFSQPFGPEKLNEPIRHVHVHTKTDLSQMKATVNRSVDLSDKTIAQPAEQDSGPGQSRTQDIQENQDMSNTADDTAHADSYQRHDFRPVTNHHLNNDNLLEGQNDYKLHDNLSIGRLHESMKSNRLHPVDEDSVGDDAGNTIYNKHVDEPEPKKVMSPVVHISGSKPSQVVSSEDDQSSGKLKSSSLVGAGKPYSSSSHKSSSKVHGSSEPSYTSQKWSDPAGLYVPYALPDTPDQRQRQHSSSGQYLDNVQYYPPYSSDTLDTLPNSLLSNLGSTDDLSQYGGSYLERDKPLSNVYQGSNRNSGYLSFSDTAYGPQYPGSNRYDYSGEYRSPTYHESDFYPPVNSQRQYRPVAGLYEDFPPGQRLPKPNTVEKSEVKPVQALSHDTGSEGQNIKPIAGLTRQPNISTTVIPKTASTTTLRTTTRVKPQSQVTTTGKPSHPRANERVFLSSEKVIIASSSSNAEGPIIALSLGLAFTIILLALVVYRLRRMRHRLKKGRPLHHNEADYLINGMYL
ncbi:nuclear receptor coactivator 6 [Biomphalaria glabrata]|nr:nuclear receptor coactivator 6 [Biomphalaria glabrata]